MSISTLGYGLLALLAKTPNTAYELSRRAHRPLGYFWTAHYGQVHPQLKLLADAGLLTATSEAGPGPHDKKVFAITPSGRAALSEWVAQPPRDHPSRDEMLLKVFAMWTADAAAARQMVSGRLAQHRAELAEYEAIYQKATRDYPDGMPTVGDHRFGDVATLRFGIGVAGLRIEWCEWLISQLDRDRGHLG